MTNRVSSPWYVAVAAPALLLAAIEAAFLVGSVADSQLRWPRYTMNLAEASAVRDAAEVVRQLEAGADPNRRRTVRAGLLADEPIAVTPLEAAVMVRRSELVRMLHQHGARLEPDAWRRGICGAERDGLEEIAAALALFAPPDAQLSCTGDEEPWPPPL